MTTKRISCALAIAAFMLAAAVAFQYAQGLELIGAETVRRAFQVMLGLVLAVYGNYIPKDIVRSRTSVCAVSRSQSLVRVGGWSFTLAGLAYAGLWAFAPTAMADVAAMPIVAAATLITAGYFAWVVLGCRLRPQDPSI